MKSIKLFFTLMFVAAFATFSMGQITGTSHDFSAEGWNGTGEICIVCHTPHNGNTTISDAPLWNHGITTATFTVYSSSTLDAAPLGQPDGQSKLCLSCHDGTVGLEDFGGAGTNTNLLTGSALVGTDLSNDHPISFIYNTALATADGGLEDPSTVNSGLGSTIDADMLFGGNLECASCHDVHDDTYGNFLIMANTASALCLTCHDK